MLSRARAVCGRAGGLYLNRALDLKVDGADVIGLVPDDVGK